MFDKQSKADLLVFTTILLGMWFLGWALGRALDTPVVHVSASTRECVRVLGPEGHPWSCESLPERYEQKWVP